MIKQREDKIKSGKDLNDKELKDMKKDVSKLHSSLDLLPQIEQLQVEKEVLF